MPGRGLPLALTRTYNSALSSVSGPFGYGWSSSYTMSATVDSSGKVTVHEEGGDTVTFAPNGSGGYSAPPRVMATLTKNVDGSYTFVRRKTQTFEFSPTGQLTTETDLNGETTSLGYNSGGQLTTVTDPAGRAITFEYGTNGLLSQVTNPAGHNTTYAYDSAGNLTSVTDPAARTTSFTYDSSHRLLTMTDSRSGVVTNVYDSSGRVTSQTDQAGRTTTYDYTTHPGSTLITDPNGLKTLETYTNGELSFLTKAYGTSQAATWAYSYDPATLGVTQVVDPLGHATTATFDSSGNRLTATDALGRTTTWTYNAYNEVTSVTPPATYGSAGPSTTTYTYDESAYSSGGAGNLTAVSTPIVSSAGVSGGTQVTHFGHGTSSHPGDVTSVVDPTGHTWAFAYDSYGDRVSETAPATADNSDTSGSYQDVTRWAYDTNTGEVTSTMSGRYMLAHPSATSCTTPATDCTTYTYDLDGETLTSTDGNGHVTTHTYDGDGNVASLTDGNGNETVYAYDADNEVTSTTSGYGTSAAQTSSTGYTPDGLVATQTNPAGKVTTYSYDSLNHLSSATDPDSRITGYQYDPVGNLLVKSDPGVSGCTTGSTTAGCTLYSYDAADELTGIDYNDSAAPNVTYAYDGNGRRTSMADGTGTSSSAYNSLGELTATTNGAGASVSYGYDLAGNQTSITYPATLGTATMGYDPQGRQDSVTDWQSNTTSFAYNADGDLATGSDPTTGAAVVDSYTYDPAGAISNIAASQGSTTLASFAYTRDAANQVTQVTSTGVPADNHTYSYNPLDQLTGVDGAASYGYDPAGNLTTTPASATQSFDPAGQLCWTSATSSSNSCSSPPTGATTYSYNSRSDRTASTPAAGGATSYGWNEANQLTTVTTPAATTTSTYDGNGVLASSTTGTATSHYVWDNTGGTPHLIFDGTTAYLYGPDGLPLEQQSPGTADAADNFNRADGTLGANWSDTADGGLAIASDEVAGTNPGGNSGDTWTATSFSSDQYSQIDVSATPLTGGQWIGVGVRTQNSGADGYYGIYDWNGGSPQLMLFKRTTDGGWQQLGSSYASGTLPAGTKLKLEAAGSGLYLLENGVVRVSAVDTGLAGGAPAIMANGTATADNWAGGNTTDTHTIGGALTGLAGSVVLQNGTDQLTVDHNGPFTLAGAQPTGAAYNVTVATNPAGQTCTLSNGAGTIAAADVTNITITCTNTATTTASDDFDRADGTLGANWADISDGGLTITSNQAAGTNASGSSGDTWTATTFSSDQYSQIDVTANALTGNQWIGAAVRSQNSGQDAYVGVYHWNYGSPGLQLWRRHNGGWTQLGATYNTAALPAGTHLQIEAVGPAISLLENGTTRITATDTELTGGAPGVMANGTPTADNWSGGNTTGAYSIGGTLTGLNGALTLQNGSDRIHLTANANFTFDSQLPAGIAYNVTVAVPPPGQTCTVANPAGTITANVPTSPSPAPPAPPPPPPTTSTAPTGTWAPTGPTPATAAWPSAPNK